MSDKVIVTAAITGSIHTPSMSPHLPIAPAEIVAEVVRAHEAGAAVAHVHVRHPETGQPIPDLALFREVATGVKSRCDIVLCTTTGGALGMTTQQRVAVVSDLRPELASCNFGSMNFALFPMLSRPREWRFPWEPEYLAASENMIFPNTFTTLREFIGIFERSGTKPELEIYDLGMVNNAAFMVERGQLKRPPYMQFVLGVLGGAPATLDNLMFLERTARESIRDFQWSVCAAGRQQMALCTAALVMGGNVRVGLEDSLYLERGVLAQSNADQVAKIVRIARELGREPATPDEARQTLGLKGLAEVNY